LYIVKLHIARRAQKLFGERKAGCDRVFNYRWAVDPAIVQCNTHVRDSHNVVNAFAVNVNDVAGSYLDIRTSLQAIDFIYICRKLSIKVFFTVKWKTSCGVNAVLGVELAMAAREWGSCDARGNAR